jgi:hypothetical protein
VLIHGAARLLGRHSRLKGSGVASGLRLHVFALRLLLGWGRGGAELLGRVLLLLRVHGLLLLLLKGRGIRILVVCDGIWVLVIGGRLLLAGDVWRLGVLLHGDCEVLVNCLSSMSASNATERGCGFVIKGSGW